MTLIPSVSFDQSEILDWISRLYLCGKGFDLDPCYGGGNFYNKFPKPTHKFDISPRVKGVKEGDCRDLSQWLKDSSVTSIIFDPPFLCGGGKNGIMHRKYGTFESPGALTTFVGTSLHEFNRILISGGILAVKCMDFVYGRKNYFFHITVHDLAAARGFVALDLFILISKNRVMQWNLKTQQHARKFHSYFWVFRKV